MKHQNMLLWMSKLNEDDFINISRWMFNEAFPKKVLTFAEIALLDREKLLRAVSLYKWLDHSFYKPSDSITWPTFVKLFGESSPSFPVFKIG